MSFSVLRFFLEYWSISLNPPTGRLFDDNLKGKSQEKNLKNKWREKEWEITLAGVKSSIKLSSREKMLKFGLLNFYTRTTHYHYLVLNTHTIFKIATGTDSDNRKICRFFSVLSIFFSLLPIFFLVQPEFFGLATNIC